MQERRRARVEGPVKVMRGQKQEQDRPDEVRAVTAEDGLPEEPLDKSVAVDDPDSLEPEGACSLPLVAGRGEGQEDGPDYLRLPFSRMHGGSLEKKHARKLNQHPGN